MSEIVLLEVTDDVAVLTLNRPERLNAWIPEMQTRYFDLLEECASRSDVRAIVVTGAGRGFCAGADMQALQQLSSGDGSENGNAAPGAGHDPRPVTFPLTISKPIIAAVNGACAGLGFVYAVMCDLRFAATEAKFTTAFARRGLVAEHGISWMLPRLIGPSRALDLLLSGRVILGTEAAELGLVNQAFAGERLLEETLSYARMLASESSPASMARMKHQVYADLARPLAESLDDANRLMAESFAGPDFGEGVRSFMERRPPQFEPVSDTPAGLPSS
jgi:enoyl-CoA hydratase/carnithine racemase